MSSLKVVQGGAGDRSDVSVVWLKSRSQMALNEREETAHRLRSAFLKVFLNSCIDCIAEANEDFRYFPENALRPRSKGLFSQGDGALHEPD